MKYKIYIISLLLFSSCATFKTQYGEELKDWKTKLNPDKEVAYSIYLVGDAGKLDKNNKNEVTIAVGKKLRDESNQSALIYLGDNIYPNGMPKKNNKNRQQAEKVLDAQINAVKNFKGKTLFIPGNHDFRKGLKGLERQKKYIEKALGNEQIFFPKNNCPIQKVKINDAIVLITINSQWFLENWDKTPKINDDCEIKTREKFFVELEGLIKKSEGKTTVIALHHPLYSNGSHGGYYSAKQHLKPLPVLASLGNLLRKTGGVSPQDLQNKRYIEFRKRIIALAQYNSKLVFVAGHEHNLQYIQKNGVTQIISGSGAVKTAIKNNSKGFSYPDFGYAKLLIFKDGSSDIQFFGVKGNQDTLVFQKEIIPSDNNDLNINYKTTFPEFVESSIYSKEETSKSSFFKKMWGKRYRKYYSTKIKAKTVDLDTLFGGLTPKRKGGGHQSVSLILINKEGKEYVMRAMRKSATKYIQTIGFKDKNVEGLFDDTFTEDLLQDVYTASHPYAPFTIATLSDAVGIYHTNPTLYYIPKQKALKKYNDKYGDALYMIEERATSGHGDLASFGYANKVISTDNMLKKLRKNSKYSIDQTAYIRARLFDMVIGDWDRHQDQWRWAQFKNKEGVTIFKPIPRDRDQAYSVMGDGFLLGIATSIIPSLQLLRAYDDKLKHPKGVNLEPYPLDMAFINGTDKKLWDEQVSLIKNNITDAVIDEAFTHFPKEVQDETLEIIKQKLKGRLDNLQHISDSYYKLLHKIIVIKGTDKKDWFEIKRLKNGDTQVTAYRSKDKHKGDLYYNKTFNHKRTKEIIVYGLDDKDHFKVYGKGNKLIRISLIGGQNNDSYNILNGKKVQIIDYKTKKNTFLTKKGKRNLTNNYKMNVYDYRNATYSTKQFLPNIGSNKDDGIKIGLNNTYLNSGFHSNHFVQKQSLKANYYTGTNGFEIFYKGEFKKIINNYYLHIDAAYTSPNYTFNYFGYGNESTNKEDELGMDYNRVKLSTFKISPSIHRKGAGGGSIRFSINYENLVVDDTPNRYIQTAALNQEISKDLFKNTSYVSSDVIFKFENKDNIAFPTLGLSTSIKIGYKNNLSNNQGFGYLIPTFGFDYKLVSSGKLVLATKLKGHLITNDSFEIYDAATIGASDGLRGFRNQRFTGKNSFYQNTDLRYTFNQTKTALLPITIGVFTGFDYGRVWMTNDASNTWHTSYGGGLLMNMSDLMSAKLGVFNSEEDTLFSVSFNIGF